MLNVTVYLTGAQQEEFQFQDAGNFIPFPLSIIKRMQLNVHSFTVER